MEFSVAALTPERWPALEALFGERGAVGGCWCMYWRIGRDYRKQPADLNKTAFHRLVHAGPPPGLLAFAGTSPWAGVT
jgi:hypothetical protein